MDKDKMINNLARENLSLKSELGIALNNFDRLILLVEENVDTQKKILSILSELAKKLK